MLHAERQYTYIVVEIKYFHIFIVKLQRITHISSKIPTLPVESRQPDPLLRQPHPGPCHGAGPVSETSNGRGCCAAQRSGSPQPNCGHSFRTILWEIPGRSAKAEGYSEGGGRSSGEE